MNPSMSKAAATIIGICGLAFFGTARAQEQPPASIEGGLERVQGSKVALAYARPGITWTKYRTVLLKPLAIPANARNTAPPGTVPEFGESYMLSDDDVSKLQDIFAKSMQTVLGNAGYTFVTTPQTDTLIVSPQIVKLSLNAPIESSRADFAGMGQTYSRGGGSITMAAVLADGKTETALAEVLDRKYGSNIMGVNNRVTNIAEARDVFDGWASDLRDKLQSG